MFQIASIAHTASIHSQIPTQAQDNQTANQAHILARRLISVVFNILKAIIKAYIAQVSIRAIDNIDTGIKILIKFGFFPIIVIAFCEKNHCHIETQNHANHIAREAHNAANHSSQGCDNI